MLHSTEHVYIENDLFTGFVKDYKNREFSFMALLPKEIGTAAFRQCAKEVDFISSFEKRKAQDVHVAMPEFRIDYEKDLVRFCKLLGIRTVFSNEADFSPMTDQWLRVNKILHKAHVELDRKGTKAATVTIALIVKASALDEKKCVILDRPFFFAIMHNKSSLPVFAGCVNELMPLRRKPHTLYNFIKGK